MEEKIKNAADEIVDNISKLPQNSEFIIGNYFKDYDLKMEEQFDLMSEVLDLCEKKDIIIENTQEGMILGMPWVYKYKKNN